MTEEMKNAILAMVEEKYAARFAAMQEMINKLQAEVNELKAA